MVDYMIKHRKILNIRRCRVHYENNAHDFIVARQSIAAPSDRSDNVVGGGGAALPNAPGHTAPTSRSGRTCLRTKSVFRLCHGAMERSLEHGLRRY